MPNWVYNNLSITDPSGEHTADVARLMEQVGSDYTTLTTTWENGTCEVKEHTATNVGLSFWNIKRPEGDDLTSYNESIGAGGAMPFWYDWNVGNWGTKWDASDVDIQEYAADHKQITFSTAWSPPVEVLSTLSKQYPNLHIELEWEEEQGFGGTFTCTNGEVTVTDEYDIPQSHADYVARDKECGCEIWADEAPFVDCPTYEPEPDPSMLIPDDELEVEAIR